MNKTIKTSIASFAFCILGIAATAQTDSTAAAPPPETPVTETPAPDPNAVTDPNAVPADASATPIVTDSTGAAVSGGEAPPATNAAGDKPATRNKLYSGRHRGNNVIYDPKK